jgi:hypothetical protein
MSMETHVFFRGKLPSKAALSRAMKELGFPFAIKPATGSLEQESGYMPMLLRREETGVEFFVDSDHFVIEEFADVGVDQSFERMASFRWGGDFREAVAGMCAAAALAKLVDGVVFDEAESELLSIDGAVELAQKNLAHLPKPARTEKPRGPRGLKRMLAPLLEKRRDLVLANAFLIIRPVRHLIRGAHIQWHGPSMRYTIAPHIRPLYQPGELFLEYAIANIPVDDPDAQAMFFARLAEEIFEPLGQIATIDHFIASSWGKRLFTDTLFPSITLSRGFDEAKAVAARIRASEERALEQAKGRLAVADRKDRELMWHRREELKRAEESLEEERAREAFLARGAAAVFAHYRDWEGQVARGYKIEEAWEPSPFPAELPVTQRTKAADPKFTPTPWIQLPDTWRQAPPETPGEVLFGKDHWDWHGRIELLHPITREQAEACHDRLEYYRLAVRLPEKQLLILSCGGSWNEGQLSPPVQYDLRIYNAEKHCMLVRFEEDCDDPGILKMRRIEVRGGGGWQSALDFKGNEIAIWPTGSCHRRVMTGADRSAYAFPIPRFGDYELLWQRISMYLSNEGFGTFV